MLDTHQLNVFLKAAETLNFTTAAQKLGMSQPSVSQHIKSLEDKFKTPLFHRSGRHLSLSEAGLILVPLARQAVKDSILIEETMSSLKGSIHGNLEVGCSTTPGKYVLPKLLADFHHQHPSVRVSCRVKPQSEAVELLKEGKVHFALVSYGFHAHQDLEFKQFMSDPVVLIAHQDHTWAQQGTIQPRQLLEGKFILREQTSGTYQAARSSLQQAEIYLDQLDTLLILGNSEAIALAVKENLGVGFVSRSVVDGFSQDQLAVVKIENLTIQRDIFIGRNTRLHASQAQKAFWNYVTSSNIRVG